MCSSATLSPGRVEYSLFEYGWACHRYEVMEVILSVSCCEVIKGEVASALLVGTSTFGALSFHEKSNNTEVAML